MYCILTVDDGTRQLLPPVYIFTTPVQSTTLPIQSHLGLVCLPSSHGEVTVHRQALWFTSLILFQTLVPLFNALSSCPPAFQLHPVTVQTAGFTNVRSISTIWFSWTSVHT